MSFYDLGTFGMQMLSQSRDILSVFIFRLLHWNN